jgi:hypothetical protein
MFRTFFYLLTLAISYLYGALPLLAQTTVIHQPIALTWKDGMVQMPISETRSLSVVQFEGAFYNAECALPYFGTNLQLPMSGKVTTKLRNATYLPIVLPNIPNINELVGHFIVPTTQVGYDKGKPIANISLLPIRKNEQSGEYEKLISADLEIQLVANGDNHSPSKSRVYADNSVLKQGNFYKFKTNETGIYRIDRQLLNDLGINETVNINHLRVYGNGGGMLPELAGADKYDDLVENPLKIIDKNNNGIFDNDDMALFYAQSPHTWTYNATDKRFEHQLNIYTDHNYYFLNFDMGEGKRISTLPETTNAATDTVTTFNDYVFHESEKYNDTHSGRLFLGENFGYTPEQKFSFSFPNIHTNTPIKVRASLVGRCVGCSNSSFSGFINDQSLFTTNTFGPISGESEDPYATANFGTGSGTVSGAAVDITLRYNKNGNENAVAWLNYLELNARRQLHFTGGQLSFRDISTVGNEKTALFTFQNLSSNAEIWDVTQIGNVQRVAINNNAFKVNSNTLREFIAFDQSQLFAPEAIGKVANQNLHALGVTDMVIVAYADFLETANQLADFHRTADNLQVAVVTTDQVFNEFASGAPDPTAIRDLMKMLYDRATSNSTTLPQYLLLMGDASYDYKSIEYNKNNNTNLVPTYQSSQSLVITSTYTTDDYFGYLDDSEGSEAQMLSGAQKLDIGIGRMPVNTVAEAQDMVDKAIHYYSPETMGDWRTRAVFIGDDEDGGTHIGYANQHADFVMNTCQSCNVEKIFLDAYRQESTPGGSRYPQVNQAINRAIYSGALLINYEGHGGEKGWAHENILDIPQTKQWKNKDKMPLFVTATCSFGRYDNPEQTSIGEQITMQAQSGAIAALTTSRLVYSFSNATLNQNVLNHLFEFENGKAHTIGELCRLAKNDMNSNLSSSNENTHKFNLLGDPALRLPLPTQKIALTNINDQAISQADTISALALVTLKGEVRAPNDNLLSDFNGTSTIAVFDKLITVNTLQNDDNSSPFSFQQRKGLLFRGKASVTNGKFDIQFISPRDIMLNYGKGRISAYAENGSVDAAGYSQDIVIGGISPNAKADNEPPQVNVFMNDENFKFGGTTHANPVLYIKVFDENGISTTGSAIGHDLSAVLDNNAQKTYLLNEYYEADINSYKSGKAYFPLYELSDGRHYIEVKAWDTQNNSGKGYTEFIVASTPEIALYEVMNFPNPFSDETTIAFEHNRPDETLDVSVQIFSLSGQLHKTIQQQITPVGFRVTDIKWDGTNDNGVALEQGMYIYRVALHSPNDNKTVYKSEQLVIMK